MFPVDVSSRNAIESSLEHRRRASWQRWQQVWLLFAMHPSGYNDLKDSDLLLEGVLRCHPTTHSPESGF
jgi:hypothetical protein